MKKLFLANNPAVCFHAHTLKDLDYENFGNFLVNHIFNIMKSCNNEKYKEFLEYYESLRNQNG